MEYRQVIHSTFVIERKYPAEAERVFAAFADAGRKRRWFVEGEKHDVESFEMDFRVGGAEQTRIVFKERHPLQGMTCVSNTTYLDIVPNRRIVSASTMAIGEHRISASLVTAELLPSENETSLVLTHQGVFFEGSDGPEMREAGWQKLLGRLAPECAS